MGHITCVWIRGQNREPVLSYCIGPRNLTQAVKSQYQEPYSTFNCLIFGFVFFFLDWVSSPSELYMSGLSGTCRQSYLSPLNVGIIHVNYHTWLVYIIYACYAHLSVRVGAPACA